MIKRATIAGRDASVAYLDANWQPASIEQATAARVVFDDGGFAEIVFGSKTKEFDPSQPRVPAGQPDGGQWAGGGSGAATIAQPSSAYTPANPVGSDTQQRFKQGGKYTEERQKLHKAIVDGAFAGKSPSASPTAIFLGGGTAAGKSHMRIETHPNIVKIDADHIKKQIPEFREMKEAGDLRAAAFAHEESSDISALIRDRAASEGYSFLLDGTGDGSIDSLARKVNAARERGIRTVAHYVTVDTEKAIMRANRRAGPGGSDPGRLVPETAIRALHREVSRVFPQAVERGLFDEFTVWDTNEDNNARIIARGRGRNLEVVVRDAWERFLAKGNE